VVGKTHADTHIPMVGSVRPVIAAETLDYLIACSEVLQDSAMNCVLSFDGSIEEARLHRALRLTLDAEPLLGCRFAKRWYRPVWERRDDLDELTLCRVRPQEPDRRAVRRFLIESFDPERDCQVRAELWRDATDTLGIKLSHKVADGQSLKQYVRLLADTYTKLADDPAYRPPSNPRADRSLGQLIPRLEQARLQTPRAASKPARHRATPGYWKRPVGPGRAEGPDVHIRQLDAARYTSVFEYALRRRATVFQVLLAALFMAARETMPHTPHRTLTIGSVVDLRGYAPDPNSLPLCNLFGVLPVVIEPDCAATLDQVIDQVREQFLAAREGHQDLVVPIFGLESRFVMRQAWRAIPYRWLESLARLRLTRRESALLLLTDVGSLNPEHLVFDDLEVTDAFVASGMIHDPVLSLLCASSYRSTMTLCSGVSHAFPPDQLLDRTLAALPCKVVTG
jgi:NRPS condensation-like uncharacterized protein